ncbi:hypothetical protein [Carnobacterium sp. TMP28]|uniref:hypothetical protein n=1 Tax=Carnobacterium sp. TMP28 TaxID=3397060 RepID=UPI0039E10A05
MNTTEFMQAVDKQLLKMTDQDKVEWMRDYARTQMGNQREIFLESLRTPVIVEQAISIKEIEEWLVKVEDQEVYFTSFYENNWDNHYEDYTYVDDFSIVKYLLKAFEIAEELLNKRDYRKAADLYDWLCTVPFFVYDTEKKEWIDDELDMERLVESQMIQINIRQICINLLYAHYQSTVKEKRASVLYRYLLWEMCQDITIEEIFSVRPQEVKDSEEFLVEWINFLQKTSGDRAGNLLTQAYLYRGGIQLLCESAGKNKNRHPILYEKACFYLYEDKQFSDCEKLGLEALNNIAESRLIRAKVANLAAKASIQLDHLDKIEQFYEAAFYSESSLIHYLRLLKLSNNEEKTHKAALFVKKLPDTFSKKYFNGNTQLNENWLSDDSKRLLRFFNKEFDFIYTYCEGEKNDLNWNNSLKGIIVPLFFLILDKNNATSKAKKAIIKKLASRLNFYSSEKEREEDYLDLWKKTVKLTPEQRAFYLVWLNQKIAALTDVIVGGGYRKRYSTAAELIVLLGEVVESNGTHDGKFKVINWYKETYSRKSAFKNELDKIS